MRIKDDPDWFWRLNQANSSVRYSNPELIPLERKLLKIDGDIVVLQHDPDARKVTKRGRVFEGYKIKRKRGTHSRKFLFELKKKSISNYVVQSINGQSVLNSFTREEIIKIKEQIPIFTYTCTIKRRNVRNHDYYCVPDANQA